MFDTLKYVKILRENGYSENQAESHVRFVREVMSDHFATKYDLEKFEMSINHKFEKQTRDLTIRLGGMLFIGLTVISGMLKYLSS